MNLSQPELVLFDDGLVVANVGVIDTPEFRSIQLLDEELDELVEMLQAADLQPLNAGSLVGGTLCADCATTIIRTDIQGETVEIVAAGLKTDVSDRYTSRLPFPAAVVALDRVLNQLRDRVRGSDSEPFDGDLPEIPTAPLYSG